MSYHRHWYAVENYRFPGWELGNLTTCLYRAKTIHWKFLKWRGFFEIPFTRKAR